MFIQLSRNEIKELESMNLAKQISRWDCIEKAASFYDNSNGIYTGYQESLKELFSAYSTPVVIYRIKKLPSTMAGS
ncbi:hypothetical protein J2T18_003532 [Paenibacillus polymyxa]|uniref:hypothetical protein n=1 Tax=Paenibacillus polymyxa TaxID=1406 RepID=UPI002791FBE3|nr:hypothetical protein [Paenibacillus polymyxa]MDQ0049231.1 hypothetical protein [Paenibacillus polymyxa]